MAHGGQYMKECCLCRELKPFTEFHKQADNTDGLRAFCKACKRERGRADYLQNREKRLTTIKAYHEQNKDRIRPYVKNWHQTHPDRVREIKKKWAEANPEHQRECKHRRRARERGAAGEHTAADIRKILEGQKRRCWWCGKKLKKYHVDHRFPLVAGGTNDPSNLVMACVPCNLSKAAKMPHEFAGRLL
jgi:5-methylcytosine-specific restriction endonuclease McrA